MTNRDHETAPEEPTPGSDAPKPADEGGEQQPTE